MDKQLETALNVFEDLLTTLERLERDGYIYITDVPAYTQAWRKEMETQVALANQKSLLS